MGMTLYLVDGPLLLGTRSCIWEVTPQTDINSEFCGVLHAVVELSSKSGLVVLYHEKERFASVFRRKAQAKRTNDA